MKHIALLFCLLPLGAQADVLTPQGKTIDCYCTDKAGARIELGETICLQVDGRMFMAQCQMSLNVPMWRETREGCLSSELKLPFTPFSAGALYQPV
ncbi:hypothetical protein [Sulfitobacter donghicola]|uniref:hypothetical protein n=1 Tax=Sulfitobacter donghicola TaxID=421000 RepID=UPI0009DEAC47|nr:hypothetical protein [Sulfitobacter donghicola]